MRRAFMVQAITTVLLAPAFADSPAGVFGSGNAQHMRAASFAAANSAGGVLKNFRGGAQIAQNTAQHGLIQQRLSVDANLKIDH